MRALVERGLVKAMKFSRSGNKLGYSYVLAPAGMKQKSELATAFLSRKLDEYAVLRQELDSLKSEIEKLNGMGL